MKQFIKNIIPYISTLLLVGLMVGIAELLNEKEIINKYEENLNQTIIVKNTESLVTVSVGKLSSGFECFDTNQLVITSQELIEGEKRKKYKMGSNYIRIKFFLCIYFDSSIFDKGEWSFNIIK